MIVYNTLSGKKEEFKPLKAGHVGIYNCGPTVYDTAQIGNFRSFVMADLVRRTFEYNGYLVNQVMNITDVDDKTIRRSQQEHKSLEELTRHYETLFIADMHSLNILTPHKLLRARDYVKEMIDMIANLLEKGIAYPTKDGIYFSIGMFPEYGKLANIKLDGQVKERIAKDEYEKENPRDFALWKFSAPEDGEVVWEAPFGKGRPGWHIECSAMSTNALGSTIDIHTGGTDLIFPHHTNEIAQSEAATGKKFVNYWIHGAFMNVNGEKMAKSKGNFIKLKDLEEMGVSPVAFRYWLLTSHYRSPIDFSLEATKGAQTAFIRLIEAFIDLSNSETDLLAHNHKHHESEEEIDYKNEFKKVISDDFNTPEGIALVWKLIKDPHVDPKEKTSLLLDFDKVLGLGLSGVLEMTKSEEIPPEVTALAETREEARASQEWNKADALRKEIEARGYVVKDNEEGYKLKKK
ncbi:MAG: cysteine--tRNA ligase [Patescibacteria group bacterium]